MKVMEPIILHVDLNSFFASVEQQVNPALRGKPIGILKAIGRTCVIANSNEAKKFGVKTGMSLSQVKTLCPQIILLPANFPKYSQVTHSFIDLCSSYSDQMEVFSLDEVFLDVTRTNHLFGGPLKLALNIQERLRTEIGDWLGCSIGIAANKLLAKLASGMAPKKGILIIDEHNQAEILAQAPFSEVCGIGWHLTGRLNALGIFSLPEILKFPEADLRLHFGPYWAPALRRLARGEDNSPLITVDQIPDPKSVSRTYTLYHNTFNLQLIKATLRNLIEEACTKLRRLGLVGRQFGLMVRGNNQSQADFVTRKTFTDSGRQVFRELETIYNNFHWPHPVRFLGVWISLLARKQFLPLPLFLNDQKQEKILQAVDQINQTYGDYTIYPATLINQTIIRPEVNGFMGDKKFQLFDKPT